MHSYDVKTLGDRLNELAEVFDKKPVGERALMVWFGVLKDFPTDRVCSVLISWPKTHTKFPTPSEVWKGVNEMQISHREAESAKMKKEETEINYHSPKALETIEKIREILKRPRPSPREVWERVEANPKACSLAKKYASDYLKRPIRQREPGDDDEIVDKKLESAGA